MANKNNKSFLTEREFRKFKRNEMKHIREVLEKFDVRLAKVESIKWFLLALTIAVIGALLRFSLG